MKKIYYWLGLTLCILGCIFYILDFEKCVVFWLIVTGLMFRISSLETEIAEVTKEVSQCIE